MQETLFHCYSDMEKNEDDQKRLDATFCKPQGYQYNYIATFPKTTNESPESYKNWRA